jgi:predicted CXXCH cytochrome family protein
MKRKILHIKTTVSLIIFFISISLSVFSQNKCNECHNSLISKNTVHAPVDDCSNCHTDNGKSHPLQNQKSFTLAENGTALCYLCHDAKNTKANIHPPADENCTICHSPHGSDNKSLLIKSPVSENCTECHEPEKKKFTHNPVAKGECNKCHNPHQSDNAKFLVDKKPAVCFSCHEKQKSESLMSNIHQPFDDNCSNCHNNHSSDNKKLLTDKTPNLCYGCHELPNNFETAKSVHSVYKDEKNCANCHSPHASENEKFLYKQNADLCYTCHNKTIKTEIGSIDNIYQKISKSKSVHVPIESDGCSICHVPHFSEFNFLLNDEYPKTEYVAADFKNFQLCFNCHETTLLTSQNTESATNFRNSKQNLHFVHIKGKKGRNCNLCHDIHASQNLHLIKETVVFGSWEMNMNYISNSNGGSCLPACHGEKKYIRN